MSKTQTTGLADRHTANVADPLALEAAKAIVDRQCSNPITVPGGQTVRCGSRFKKRCPGCANLASGDWAAIIRSGFDNAPASARFLMVTLTAPSFGPTHWVVKPGRAARRCRCGATHDPERDADLRGTPLHLDDYDYAGAVAWNHASPDLLHNFVRSLRDSYPSLAYVVVREWQERGLLHFHMLIRIHAADMPSTLEVESVARTVTAKTLLGHLVRFGEQVRAEFARAGESLCRSIWYLTKSVQYLVKEIELGLGGAGRYARAHLQRLTLASQRSLRCRRCPDDERTPCHARCHRQWGARSHVVTQSRGKRAWSLFGLTRKRQREQRAEWASEHSTGTGPRRFALARQARSLLQGDPLSTPSHPTAGAEMRECVAAGSRGNASG